MEKKDYAEARKTQITLDRLWGLRTLWAEKNKAERNKPAPDETAEETADLSELNEDELRELAEENELAAGTEENATDERSDS